MTEISIVIKMGHGQPEINMDSVPTLADDDPVILRKSDLDRLTKQISGSDQIIISVGTDQSGNIYVRSSDHRGSPGFHSFRGFIDSTDMASAIKSYTKKDPTK